MSLNSRNGIRRLLGTLAWCAASFIAAGFFGAAFAASHDFNGDARSDILWRNIGTGTGQALIWLLNSTTVLPTSGSPGAAADPPWAIVGQRDFNGDGFADILWRNDTTGQALIWLMNGATLIGSGSPGTMTTDWTVAGTGDFNGDGMGDVLWYNTTTGQAVIWLLNGTSVIGDGSPGTVPPFNGWGVIGTGDFNGDGFADILWQNFNTGQLVIWLMNGTTVIGGGSPGSADTGTWFFAGTGDFNGDAKTDILWVSFATGQAVIWLLNGTTVIGGGSPGSAPSPWAVSLIGDYNGDGMSDILWRHFITGQMVMWFINGTTVIGGGSPGTAATEWQIQTINAD